MRLVGWFKGIRRLGRTVGERIRSSRYSRRAVGACGIVCA